MSERYHQLLEGLAYIVQLRRLPGPSGGVADGEHGIDSVFLEFRKGLAYLGGIEVPDPGIGEAYIGSRQHQVGEYDGRVGLGGIHSVVLADPGLAVAAADDEDDGSIEA